MKQLPENLTQYHKSPVFTQDTIPEKLIEVHDTKEQVWALICVQKGSLQYTILDENRTYTLTPEKQGVIEPLIPHNVKPIGEVEFYVEFYR